LSRAESDEAHVAAVVGVRNLEFVPQIAGWASIYRSVLLYLTGVNIMAHGQRMRHGLQGR
jgi:hypothetical protein